MIEYLLLIVPALLGGVTTSLCGMSKDAGSTVNFRPPPIVFGIVWPILYILIGISWVLSVQNMNKQLSTTWICIFFLLLNIALCAWIYTYSCAKDPKDAIYVIVISIVFALWCFISGDTVSKLLLAPLLGWLFLATLMNIREVELLGDNSGSRNI